MTETPPSPQSPPHLRLGRLLATPAAAAALAESGVSAFTLLNRHARGDWGELPEEDRQQNDLAAESSARVLSCYRLTARQRIWIITEADRSLTTILLPDEY